MIAQRELSLVIGAPEFIGLLSKRQRSALSMMTHSTAALDQPIAIQHRMDSALGLDRYAGEPAEQLFADLSSPPAGVLPLHVQDAVLYLKTKLVGAAIGTATSIREAFKTALLITIGDLYSVLREIPNSLQSQSHPQSISNLWDFPDQLVA